MRLEHHLDDMLSELGQQLTPKQRKQFLHLIRRAAALEGEVNKIRSALDVACGQCGLTYKDGVLK